tara:strand:+ start:708 stop:1139 length:432 start_codon:yes stop_codon:yes gene_type:complete
MFPFEIITMLGSTLISSLLSLWSQRIKAKQDEQKMLLQRAEFQQQAVDAARNVENVGFQWTRRIIALSSIFAIIIFPKLVAVYYPDVDVTVGYTLFQPGFLFFTDGREVFQWITFKGLVITQLDTNLVSAIIGMYFGGSLVKK